MRAWTVIVPQTELGHGSNVRALRTVATYEVGTKVAECALCYGVQLSNASPSLAGVCVEHAYASGQLRGEYVASSHLLYLRSQ